MRNKNMATNKTVEESNELTKMIDVGGNNHTELQQERKISFAVVDSLQNPRKLSRNVSRIEEVSEAALSNMRHISLVRMASVSPQDEDQERGNWSNPVEFILTCLGFAVGLGNVWRFPYLCYRNGGGAFLIPYLIMLFLCGLPLSIMEMTMGQYSGQGPLTVWSMCPMFKGIGISMTIVNCLSTAYYNLITGWCLYYLLMSMRAHLPWSCCDYDSWASTSCLADAKACPEQINYTEKAHTKFNESNSTSSWTQSVKFSADDYFHHHFLSISAGIEELGQIQWPILLGLLIAWVIVFLVLMKGIKSIGKTVYFSTTFPYVVMAILLIRASIEPGAAEGIEFFFTPKWEKLLEPRVWSDAAAQVFYSTGVCFGGVITLASYNRFSNNLYKEAIFVGIADCLTSIFSGCVVFSILGFMAKSLGVSIDEVATSGPGLTFITYPQAVSMLPNSPVWSCLFFVMLLTLALSSMFPTTEAIATALIDQFPNMLRPYKFFITAGVCASLFLLGIPLTAQGGIYVLEILDTFAVGYTLLILGFIEVSIISWRYGYKRLFSNLKEMIGYSPCRGWLILWCFVTPALLAFATVFNLLNVPVMTYGNYTYPGWSSTLGWILVIVSLSPIPIYALVNLMLHRRDTGDPTWVSIVFLTSPSFEFYSNARKFSTADHF